MLLNGKEIELRLSPLAVEGIEEHFNAPIDEVFAEERKFKAKDVMLMLYAMAEFDTDEVYMSLSEFKKALSKDYNYNDCIAFLTKAISPNDLAVETVTAQE